MVIDIAAGGGVRLIEAADLRRLHVQLAAGSAARAALATLGRQDGDTHLWIAPEKLRALAGKQDAAWEKGFAGMLAYAASKGWTDQAGAVRVHVEGPPMS